MPRREPGHPPAQRQLRRYILGSFYVLILMLPPVVAVAVLAGPTRGGDIDPAVPGGAGDPTGGGLPWDASWGTALRIAFVVAFTLHCVVSARAMHLTVAHEVDAAPLPRWVLPTLAGTTGASTVCILLASWATGAATAPRPLDDTWPVWPLAATLIVAACALTPLLSTLRATTTALVLTAAVTATAWVQDPWPELPPAARLTQVVLVVGLPTLFMAVAMVLTTRWSVFILRSVDEQSRTDAMRADLAVAEERLRIARDMHDVMGRTLTAVALKSDLAAAFADSGASEQAARESRAIHDLATESLAELRGVLAGYRRPDLATELAGARSLLQSAGVETRIIGDSADVPAWAGEPLSWVLREAATNIVRHSDATRATLRLGFTAEGATLTMTNDGLHRGSIAPGPTPSPGSGLAGLAARLEALGGSLESVRSAGTFTVTARIPRPIDEGDALVPVPGSADAPPAAPTPAPSIPATSTPPMMAAPAPPATPPPPTVPVPPRGPNDRSHP